MVRKWLKMMRIHTSCLTQAGMIIGCLLAGAGNLWNIVLVAVIGLLFHIWGFIDNNLQDYSWDKKDPHKKHFPSVDGSIKHERAAQFAALSGTIAMFLVIWASGRSFMAIGFTVAAFLMGMGYNHLSKYTTLAPLLISGSFSMLPLVGYTIFSSDLSPEILMVAGFAFIMMMYQISVEGYMKDLKADPVSLMRDMGVVLKDDQLKIPLGAYLYGLYIRVCIMTILFLFISVHYMSPLFTLLLIVVVLMQLMGHDGLMSMEEFDHKDINRMCAFIEIMTYLGLVFALSGIFGTTMTVFLTVYPITWFVVLNKLTWGTVIMPDV